MARVLVGTPPRIVDPPPVDSQPALHWVYTHYEALRGHWIAVRLRDPELVAQAPTLTQLWERASRAVLSECLLHYVTTVEHDRQATGPAWQA